jgi:UDP-N-acetylmuramoyl-L-alanyl-D-glutamate--2,6-diaminopimelate ligase
VLGVSPDVVAAGLAGADPVPGRFEPVDAGQPFTVSSTTPTPPTGSPRCSTAARRWPGAVTVVFGCGGDRDPSKRP